MGVMLCDGVVGEQCGSDAVRWWVSNAGEMMCDSGWAC